MQETVGQQEHDNTHNRRHDVYAGEWTQEQMYEFMEDFENFKRKKRIRRKTKAEEMVPTIDNEPEE